MSTAAEMRISKATDPKDAGIYLAERFIEEPFVPIRMLAIGQEATFRAVSAIIHARGVAYTNGIELIFTVEHFQQTTKDSLDGELWTGVKFIVYPVVPRSAAV